MKRISIQLMCMLSLVLAVNARAEVVVESEGMTVYGQHELPKVLYVVPWKRKDAPEIDTPQTGSLSTDVLTPIDPDIFKRQTKYYSLMAKQLNKQ